MFKKIKDVEVQTPIFRGSLLVGELVTKGLPNFLPMMGKSEKCGNPEKQEDKVNRLEMTKKQTLLHP